jgi:hypothetical protein
MAVILCPLMVKSQTTRSRPPGIQTAAAAPAETAPTEPSSEPSADRAPERAVGRRTWEEFMADQLTSSSDSRSSLLRGADSRWEAEGDTRTAS